MANKAADYHLLILEALGTIFDPESDNYIDINLLAEGDNATEFTHALANRYRLKYTTA